MNNVTIYFRTGGVLFTAVDKNETMESVGQRMVAGGFLLCRDIRHKSARAVVVNLKDVESVIFENWKESGEDYVVDEAHETPDA